MKEDEASYEIDRFVPRERVYKEYERRDLWNEELEQRPCVGEAPMTYEALEDKLCRRPTSRDIYLDPAGAKFRDSLDYVARERAWMLLDDETVCCPKNLSDQGTGKAGYIFGMGEKLINSGFKCRALMMYCKGFLAGVRVEELEIEMYKRSNICRYHINTTMGCFHQPDCLYAHPDHLVGINEKYYVEQMKVLKQSKDKPEKPKHMKYLADLQAKLKLALREWE